jgi:AraC-like DNA-binding protein
MNLDVVFLIFSIQLFGFALLLLVLKKNRLPGDRLLGAYSLTYAIYYMVCWYCYNKNPIIAFIPIRFFHPVISLIGSFIYTYTLILSTEKQKFKPQYLLYFSPLILPYLLDLMLYFRYDSVVFTKEFYYSHIVTLFEYYFPLSVIIVFTFFMIKRLIHFRQVLINHASETKIIDFNWLKRIHLLCLVASVGSVLILFVSQNLGYIKPFDHDAILRIVLGFALLIGAYSGFTKKNLYANYLREYEIATSESKTNKLNNDPEKQCMLEKDKYYEENFRIFTNLSELMTKEKLFLEPELNLQTLAQKLDVSINKLSNIINSLAQKNFFEYINGFRCEEVKRVLMQSTELQKDIVSIGFESGFNSKSSFFRIFKNYEGCTPCQFHAHIHQG